jgi:hypothetical protein
MSCVNSPEARVELHLAFLKCGFLRKMGPFFGGISPAVAPEGDLVFRGKPSRPLTLFNDEIYICTSNWGIGYAKTKELGNPF